MMVHIFCISVATHIYDSAVTIFFLPSCYSLRSLSVKKCVFVYSQFLFLAVMLFIEISTYSICCFCAQTKTMSNFEILLWRHLVASWYQGTKFKAKELQLVSLFSQKKKNALQPSCDIYNLLLRFIGGGVVSYPHSFIICSKAQFLKLYREPTVITAYLYTITDS